VSPLRFPYRSSLFACRVYNMMSTAQLEVPLDTLERESSRTGIPSQGLP
jgi:hypothetical protein